MISKGDASKIQKRIVILLDENRIDQKKIDWSTIGLVVTEISHLYQMAKERDIDLVLVDETHTELKKAVANRIRRYNGLTDIWKIVDDSTLSEMEPFIDGLISADLSANALIDKLKSILDAKDLLAQYNIVGRSSRMKTIVGTIQRIASADVAVIIEGPSGSGKELVANAIHVSSSRSSKPFVAVNCGAISEGILESELFGHEKGAFTGSISKREGLFKRADGGTIFLDEIGETKPAMQVKLLRVLEDGTYYPVGSSQSHQTDVRVISATNRDLVTAVGDGEFREDLYFRLGVVKIILPALLDRKEDIQPLLQHFWGANSALDYSDRALERLTQYDWPGNIRQLRNFTDRMVALKGKGLVDVDDVNSFISEQQSQARNLPVATGKSSQEVGQELIYHAILKLGNEIKMMRNLIVANLPSGAVDEFESSLGKSDNTTVENMERALIERALEETNGNRKEAARRLGISERTLYRKISKFDLR